MAVHFFFLFSAVTCKWKNKTLNLLVRCIFLDLGQEENMPPVGRIMDAMTVLVNTSSTQWATSAFSRHLTVQWMDEWLDG